MKRTKRAPTPRKAGTAKVAVSLPSDLFDLADAHAARLGVSRSQLYAQAISQYLARTDRTWMTAAYAAAYGSDTEGTGRYGDPDDDTMAFVRSSAAHAFEALAADEGPSRRSARRASGSR